MKSGLLALILLFCSGSVLATNITMYKSPTCGCCSLWAKKMEEGGFTVETVMINNDREFYQLKQKHKIPMEYMSCHTAVVDGYVIEGHVPADDIKRLLKERPNIIGLSTPGMPGGSPGMDDGYEKEAYSVMTFDANDKRTVYSSH
ncbi:DUF411 domain-containing protein [Limnobaculum zhutongyuii]|uniref:DUF411 domain-containing protein n=1 Tax=Limnobaculum zhutongyuii TaxID=2498113 RepID=A0A411WKZ9_9GAMM|nr:DUF411 domain-containing protein [Limnobaculum zhutongyuii]QBH96904.1 DUF411 domain-containing protein [Limnobaculum zhutongyuii]TQS87008.1 DUF411 domain-containing protein [Limnobaculum zhutongyuii]